MPKFSNPSPQGRGPLQTQARSWEPDVLTHEGGAGYLRTPRSELFVAAVTTMAEDSFYESAAERQARIAALVGAVLRESDGPDWLASFLPWLRHSAHMRSAPVILLAEMAAAGATELRSLVPQVLSRADEPGELLGYWLAVHGRKMPAGLKRGIADSAAKLYNEFTTLRYDGQSRGVRMGDVVELTHPRPSTPWQSDLFRHLIDRRHNRTEPPPSSLGRLTLDRQLLALPIDSRRANMHEAVGNGWSWERLAGWLPGGMDAAAWEAVIPTMGYMALLRNLRNFDEAGVSQSVRQGIAAKLADQEEVARSRQFPYRFWSAWKAAPAMHWGMALEAALDLSCQNVPDFPGRTLVLIDTSGSMQSPVGGSRSQAERFEVAALFAAALAKRTENVDVVMYATESKQVPFSRSTSVLRFIETIRSSIGMVGMGTNTWEAVANHWDLHDRIVILTDEQAHDRARFPVGHKLPFVHTVNLAGYQAAHAPSIPKLFAYAGFTDSMFRLMPLLEAGSSGHWPWETS